VLQLLATGIASALRHGEIAMNRSSGMVAAGRLCQRDMDILGTGLHRLYPVRNAGGFDDLLVAIDAADRAAGSRIASNAGRLL
jgi:hypothetical protein